MQRLKLKLTSLYRNTNMILKHQHIMTPIRYDKEELQPELIKRRKIVNVESEESPKI